MIRRHIHHVYSQIAIQIQMFLSKLSIMSKTNKLSFAIEKCNVLHIGPKNPIISYSLNNRTMKTCNSAVKDLGIMVSQDLKWNQHMEKITKSVKLAMFTFFKTLKNHDHKF